MPKHHDQSGLPPSGVGICPHLGIAEDPQTSLAYPSEWNLCQRSRPALSARLDHQRTTCLLPGHTACPVFLSEDLKPLPAHLRKSQPSHGSRKWVWLFVVMVLIGLGLWVAWRSSPGLAMLFPDKPVSFETAQPASTQASYPVAITLSPVPTVRSTLSQATSSPPTSTPVQVATSTPEKNCGYALEEGIELEQHSLILHQVTYGESLDMLALNYDTSLQAIQALNYFLPTPLWADIVVIIPVGSTEVDDLPIFEPVLVTEPVISLDLLSRQMSELEGSLVSATLDADCPAYAGWVLVTRPAKKNP